MFTSEKKIPKTFKSNICGFFFFIFIFYEIDENQ